MERQEPSDLQETAEVNAFFKGRVKTLVYSTLLGIVLFYVSRENYLFYHSLVEIFSIIIAFSIFMFVWNGRDMIDSEYLVFLGIGYLFIGGLDLLHVLSYKGMGVFKGFDADLPTQLWIIARIMESLTLFFSPIFLSRSMNRKYVFLGYAAVTAAALCSVFYWRNFPACFKEGAGLTGFKIAAEYVVSLILAGSILMLYRHRRSFNDRLFFYMVSAIAVTIVSELSFTLYNDVYGVMNFAGHFLKIISFYLVYRAIIHTGFRDPFQVLFKKLQDSERNYRSLFTKNLSGIAFHEILCDPEGRPVDYRFLAVNPAFEDLTGLKAENILGKTVLEVLPATEKYWIETYGKVALDGVSCNFRNYSAGLDRHYDVIAYQPVRNHFACIFQDVTSQVTTTREREELVAKLQSALNEIRTLRGILPICSNCKKIRDDQGAWSALEEYIQKHTDAEFSHGICPDCIRSLYPEYRDRIERAAENRQG